MPKIANLRESAGFAGVIRASFMGALFVIVIVTVPVIAVVAGSARPNMLQNYRLHGFTQIKILII